MTFSFDPTGDLETIADGLETLTYEPLDGDAETVSAALRRGVSKREAEASAGVVSRSDVKFRLPTSELSDEPALGAAFIDAAGVRWTILSVAREVLGACWSCVVRNLEVAAGLDHTVVIEQASFTKSAGGAPEPTWSEFTTLRARLQPLAVSIEQEFEQSIALANFRLILERSLDWSPSRRWRVRVGDVVYAVIGYERPERIDVLPALLLAQSPWPWN
ncbi:MAG TPA: head-tail adaptor protein [Pirellulales bacterium]